ncbi:hypothetical protein LUZ60_012835 [Juncus effusus]|nr:hypothetical protein LUZ60_012835 [Juncus effusus]
MVDGIIGSLLIKIGVVLGTEATKIVCSALKGEVSALSRFRDEISDIKEEILSIQGFLRESERFREKSENIKNYVREVRGVAFEIEDIIDEFTYKLDEKHNEGAITRTIKKIRHVKTWHQLTKRLSRIKARIKDIEERRKRYDMSGIVMRAAPQAGGSWRSADDEHFVKEGDVIGIEENKNMLMELLNDDKKEQKIISVWGMGGVGKTALVTQVYKAVKNSFDACVWITVSQTWDRDQLLRNILLEFQRENENENISHRIDSLDHRSLVEKIQRYLQSKKYLIILDDVWSVDAWRSIRNALSSDGKIGRIILTTRIREVALLTREQQIIEVTPLQMNHSLDLFCKTAFEKNEGKTCPPELSYWAMKLVERCRGLPLAILALAGLMACKEQNEREWKKVYEDLEHELAENPNIDYVNKILNLSFEELPFYLKNCILYCSIFPEDYIIERNRLVRLWVGEGFIEKREKRTLEELAEDYIGELVSRCLLQVTERNLTGRVKECSMHDIIRALALSKSKEERFCMVCDSLVNVIVGDVRRLSIQNKNFERATDDISNLRSFVVFNKYINLEKLSLVLRSFKLLRVLDLQDVPLEKLPKEVFDLFNLHFLGLKGTKVAEIPKAIGRLQNLQVLDARSWEVSLPKELTTLRKLRHLYIQSAVAPNGICYLKDLQTLEGVKADDDLTENIINLTGLRSLCLSDVTNKQCAKLFLAISNMSQLTSLAIDAENGEVLNLSTFNPPSSLQKLLLACDQCMESLPQLSISLQNHKKLAMLYLSGSTCNEDTIFHLQACPFLLELHIRGYVGKRLCFPETALPKLCKLSIRSEYLNQIEIKRGAMPNLNELIFGYCPELMDLPQGLEYLSNLESFIWYSPDKGLVVKVRKERLENQCSEARKRVLSVIRFIDILSGKIIENVTNDADTNEEIMNEDPNPDTHEGATIQ